MDKKKVSKVCNQMSNIMYECLSENRSLSLNETIVIMVCSLCTVMSTICDENGLSYGDVMTDFKEMIDVTMKGQGDE